VKRLISIAAVVASYAFGCVDVTPILVIDESDGGSPDAAAEQAACVACFEKPNDPGPGCGDELAACRAYPSCRAVIDCILEAHCVTQSRDQEVRCAAACFEKVGVRTAADPASVLGAKLDACVRAKCAAVCPAYR
jgi:hypothetical protein